MDGGHNVYRIVGSVFGINIMLVGFAAVTLLSTSSTVHVTAVAAGSAIVGTLLRHFDRPRG
jgi:hypothetical protein